MAKIIKSLRPYILGGYVDYLPSTEACILSLAFDYLKLNDLDILTTFRICDDDIDKNFIRKVYKIAKRNGVYIPKIWYVYLVEKLCYDLMDIKRNKLAYYINEYEHFNNKGKYSIKEKLQKTGLDKRKGFHDTLKTTRDLARRRTMAVKRKGKNKFQYPENSILFRDKAQSRPVK